MSQSIEIHFDLRAGGHPEVMNIDKFRNYAEELSLSLDRSELGVLPMGEADAATTHVRIMKIRKRNVRRCLALVKELLEKHYMTDAADVRVNDGAD
jgi:hypothetical protein